MGRNKKDDCAGGPQRIADPMRRHLGEDEMSGCPNRPNGEEHTGAILARNATG